MKIIYKINESVLLTVLFIVALVFGASTFQFFILNKIVISRQTKQKYLCTNCAFLTDQHSEKHETTYNL